MLAIRYVNRWIGCIIDDILTGKERTRATLQKDTFHLRGIERRACIIKRWIGWVRLRNDWRIDESETRRVTPWLRAS
jgi:hypothetical protein